MQKDISEVITYKETNLINCIVCNKPFSNTNNGILDKIGDKSFYICAKDIKAFNIGRQYGREDINTNILKTINELGNIELQAQITELLYLNNNVDTIATIPSSLPPNPRAIVKFLDNYIIGQKEAKKRLSIAIYKHQLACNKNLNIDKTNILLVGPTGCGKSLIAHTVSKILNNPFIEIDATSYSPSGYTGGEIDTIIHDLYLKSNNNLKDTERGIIFIDELDKIASISSEYNIGAEIFHKNTQNCLLKLIEGKEIKINQRSLDPIVTLNSKDILFFGGGAFEGIAEIVGRLMGYRSRAIGIRSYNEISLSEAIDNFDILSSAPTHILNQALIEYGMSPELIGRLGVIVPLSPLNKEELYKCLTEIDNSILNQQQKIFNMNGYDIDFTEDFINGILDIAIKMNTGARALAYLVEKATFEASYALFEQKISLRKKGGVIITAECINNPSAYRLIRPRRGKTKQKTE